MLSLTSGFISLCLCLLGTFPILCLRHHGEERRQSCTCIVVNSRLFPGPVWTRSHRAPIALCQGNTTATQRQLCPANGDQFPLEGHVSHDVQSHLRNASLSFLGPLGNLESSAASGTLHLKPWQNYLLCLTSSVQPSCFRVHSALRWSAARQNH